MKFLLVIYLFFTSALLSAQTNADIDWLNKHISPIKTVHSGNSRDDLHPLKRVVKDARIVALGECTHGSREIFLLKHRLLEYLVEEMDFTIFAIEGDIALAGVINEFILSGKGDSAKVVGSLDPIWKTQEVWEMIRWMRAYNEREENKIQFMGFDMQNPWGILHNLEGFAKESDDSQLAGWLSQVNTLQQKVEQRAKTNRASRRDLLRLFEQVEKRIFASKASDFIRRNAQALVQLSNMQQAQISITGKAAYNARDQAMAENVESILSYYSTAKVVLWAHNAHVNKTGGMFKTMGYYLFQKYKTDYVSVGFATGSGSFTAGNQEGILTRNNLLLSPVENSFESWLCKAREKQFLLNLKATSVENPESKWLYEKKMFRNIGWQVPTKSEYQFIPQPALPDLFDAIIYVDKTSSTHAYLAKE